MTDRNMIRVGSNRMIALRYIMKNSSGEIIVNTMDDVPVKFRYGSGEILPGLEGALAGLKIGGRKSFTVSKETAPGLDGTFHFDVVIDDIDWAEDASNSNPVPDSAHGSNCGPGCDC